MGVMLDTIGQLIAGYLQKEVPGYEPFTPSDPEHLRGVIEPGDVLLVEGNNRISGIIKYLTQSTWSHGALYVGPVDGAYEPDGEPHVLIEANIGEGVTSAPLSKYYPYHTRVCRPIGLSYEDRTTVCRYAINRIGFGYDTKNIVDLMRFLIPLPIPQRWRRRMIAFGSGDPTKIICSALIAQAFDAVGGLVIFAVGAIVGWGIHRWNQDRLDRAWRREHALPAPRVEADGADIMTS